MAFFRSPTHIARRIVKITTLLAQGKLNALTMAFERDKPLATLVVQDITYASLLASSPKGDVLSIEYLAGGTAGAEVVTVTDGKISIQIEDGVSTATEVKAAFDAESEATDLATATITGTAGDPQDAAVETNLVNPATLNFRINSKDMTTLNTNDTKEAVLIEQDLTFTSKAGQGKGGNDITMEYTAGATAGAEVVTVVDKAISVQIEDGVSDADEVKAAIDAKAEALALVDTVVSGTGGTAQDIFGPTNLAGGEDQITFNFPDDSPGSETFTVDKDNILILKRLRTKKYKIEASAVARVTIT